MNTNFAVIGGDLRIVKLAKMLAEATNTDPLYEMEDGGKNAHELVNGTDATEQSSSASGGATSAGQDMSQPAADAKTAAESQSSSSSAGESQANAYELSQSSASKSASSSEASMPIFIIIAIIVLIAIFVVGYAKKDDEDFDDY